MPNVCVDNSFAIDDAGVLSVHKAGEPPDLAWPFPSDPADTNGLNYDPALGLWVAPEKKILQVQFSHSNAPGNTVFNGNITGSPLVANVINPSSFLTMLLVLSASIDFVFGQGNDTTGSYSKLQASVNRDNPTAAYVIRESHVRASGIVSGDTGWNGTWTYTFTDILLPGVTATYRVTPRLTGVAGYSVYLGTTERLDGFGISI